jgi:hypothetical protein
MPLPMKERDLQRQLVDWLRIQHYTVLEVAAFRQRSRCPACGHTGYPRGATGTAGAPDLLLFAPGLRGTLLGLEVKVPGGRVRPEQRALAELGATRIVRSLEDVQQALMECGMPVSIGGPR